jgi:cell wall-associated NlpC family hydrolase
MDETREIYTREFIVSLANKFIGIPYIWGGSNPHYGFDCSGFTIWILQVVNILGPGDWTADNLYKTFKEVHTPKIGDLVFYGTGKYASHVTIYVGTLNGVNMQIGASGGGSRTTTEEIAKSQNAMVKMKPVTYRSDLIGYRDISKKVNNGS